MLIHLGLRSELPLNARSLHMDLARTSGNSSKLLEVEARNAPAVDTDNTSCFLDRLLCG